MYLIRTLSVALLGWLYLSPLSAVETENDMQAQIINFWSGNRTPVRVEYEREVIIAILNATQNTHGHWQLKEQLSDYIQEAEVFTSKGHDLFVTVAGNQKFMPGDRIAIPVPLVKGLLGYRVPIIRAKDQKLFSQIDSVEQLRKLRAGIPETWSDAVVYRHNDYSVIERGSFDELFKRLSAGEIDYAAFGANEVENVFETMAKIQGDLTIETTLLIYYPFPLVFYVNPQREELANRVQHGLDIIVNNGVLDAIFERYYSDIVARLNLNKRHLLTLENPLLPEYMKNMTPLKITETP